jgi:Phage integrase family
MSIAADHDAAPTIVNSSVARTREYLTEREIEKLMATARKSSRYGHRDATMILIAYRHGFRASELCDLQWHQVELNSGRLHVRRAKRGTPAVHTLQGDEIRALRRLQREQDPSPHVFATERGGPMTPKSFHQLISRLGSALECPSRFIRTCSDMAAVTHWRTRGTTLELFRHGSATRTSSTPSAIPSCRRRASATFGGNGGKIGRTSGLDLPPLTGVTRPKPSRHATSRVGPTVTLRSICRPYSRSRLRQSRSQAIAIPIRAEAARVVGDRRFP